VNEREIHVEKKTLWSVVITDQYGKRDWLHDSEQEAIERADRMYAHKLATKRGDDIL
jgi:hypothetical protein